MLLAFYALGLAVPFILSALAFSTVSGLFRFFRDHYARHHRGLRPGPDRDGRAALHERADALNSEALCLMDDLGINFFSEL